MADNSNIRHTLISAQYQCVLCKQPVLGPASAHFCAVEARIREIIREELQAHDPQHGAAQDGK